MKKKKTSDLDIVDALFDRLTELPRSKIVTLVCPALNNPVFTIDCSEDGQWGYSLEHPLIFINRLHIAIHEGGCMIVRQFHDEYHPATGMPLKTLFGFRLGEGQVMPLTPHELAECCERDENGNRIDKELEVDYAILR